MSRAYLHILKRKYQPSVHLYQCYWVLKMSPVGAHRVPAHAGGADFTPLNRGALHLIRKSIDGNGINLGDMVWKGL